MGVEWSVQNDSTTIATEFGATPTLNPSPQGGGKLAVAFHQKSFSHLSLQTLTPGKQFIKPAKRIEMRAGDFQFRFFKMQLGQLFDKFRRL